MLRCRVEIPSANKPDSDTYEGDTIQVFVKDCGALVVQMGIREQYCYASGFWQGYTLAEVDAQGALLDE